MDDPRPGFLCKTWNAIHNSSPLFIGIWHDGLEGEGQSFQQGQGCIGRPATDLNLTGSFCSFTAMWSLVSFDALVVHLISCSSQNDLPSAIWPSSVTSSAGSCATRCQSALIYSYKWCFLYRMQKLFAPLSIVVMIKCLCKYAKRFAASMLGLRESPFWNGSPAVVCSVITSMGTMIHTWIMSALAD